MIQVPEDKELSLLSSSRVSATNILHQIKRGRKKDDELMLMIKRFQNDYIISLGIPLKNTYFADRDRLFDQIELP